MISVVFGLIQRRVKAAPRIAITIAHFSDISVRDSMAFAGRLKTSEIAQSQRTTQLNKVTTYCKAKSLRLQRFVCSSGRPPMPTNFSALVVRSDSFGVPVGKSYPQSQRRAPGGCSSMQCGHFIVSPYSGLAAHCIPLAGYRSRLSVPSSGGNVTALGETRLHPSGSRYDQHEVHPLHARRSYNGNTLRTPPTFVNRTKVPFRRMVKP